MFQRDAERMRDVRKRVNVLPLGSAARRDTVTYPLDRRARGETIGMEGNSRKTAWTASATATLPSNSPPPPACAWCTSAACLEELIIWMSQNFGFIKIADRFYQPAHAIMPSEETPPDVPELARGKTGRVVGHLMGLITLMKGQPLAYNKDNQEDKEPLFDTVDTLKDTLRIFAEMIGGQAKHPLMARKEAAITVNAEAMRAAALKGYATADRSGGLPGQKRLALRDAHETVAHAVKLATQKGVDLSELPLAALQAFNPNIAADVFEVLSLQGSLNARNTLGGTAPVQVRMPFREATALVTVEREGVIHSQVMTIRGDDPTVNLKVQEGWGPNVYVSVMALRGGGLLAMCRWLQLFHLGLFQVAPANGGRPSGTRARNTWRPRRWLPVQTRYRLGAAEIRVGIDDRTLAVTVKATKKNIPYPQPPAKITIEAKLAPKKRAKPRQAPMVGPSPRGPGLLELKTTTPGNLLALLPKARPVGVETSTAQMEIIGRRHYGRKAVAAGGGGGGGQTRECSIPSAVEAPTVVLDAQLAAPKSMCR
ncbi:hypothetical protein FQA39_LY19337 [Lamprigera yunnana]|nr:hypothetical protein FQA39_LY19337 [Lamprigera yunnana]